MSRITDAERISQLARHRVREGVEDMIVRGEIESGSQLKQIRLAKKFGVGQGVVREALIELQAMGLVESVDHRGLYVTQINGKKLLDSYDVREGIEGMAVRLCCKNCSTEDRRELAHMAEEILRLHQSGSTSEGATLDREFHHRLVELSGNGELLRVINNYRAFGKIALMNRDPQAVFDDHMAILDSIKNGDADQAERAVREHIANGKSALEAKLQADPHYVPEWVM